MNCKVCGAPLQQGARFCPNCGTTTNEPYQGNNAGASSLLHSQHLQMILHASCHNTRHFHQPTVHSKQHHPGHQHNQLDHLSHPPNGYLSPTQESQAGAPMSPFQPPAPLPYYQNNTSDRGANMPPTADSRRGMRPRRRS